MLKIIFIINNTLVSSLHAAFICLSCKVYVKRELLLFCINQNPQNCKNKLKK